MNILLSARLGGWLLVALGALQALPAIAAWVYGEPMAPYFVAGGIGFAGGPADCALGIRVDDLRVRPRDGFFIVSGAWLLASAFGALPYLTTATLSTRGCVLRIRGRVYDDGLHGDDPHRADAAFYSVVEGTHSVAGWHGHCGLYHRFDARIGHRRHAAFSRRSARAGDGEDSPSCFANRATHLWFVYLGLTAIEIAALWLAGLSFFDALCHSLTNVSTGGFSTQADSVGAFGSALVEWIVIVFMILGGINFVLHYRVLTGRAKSLLKDRELRYFLTVMALATAAISLVAWYGVSERRKSHALSGRVVHRGVPVDGDGLCDGQLRALVSFCVCRFCSG